MVRHGMVTIGVAVQAEAFASESRATNTLESYTNDRTFSDNSSPTLTSSSKSAIFLPPSRNGQAQSLKISFQYNKEHNLPEVVVNYNEEGEDQHLQLKELNPNIRDDSRPSVIGQEYPKKKANAVQVYYFERIDKPYSTQIFEVPPDYNDDQEEEEVGGGSGSGRVKAIEYFKTEGDSLESLVPFTKKSIVAETDMNSSNSNTNDGDGGYTAPPGIWAVGEKVSKFDENAKPVIVVEKVEEASKESPSGESNNRESVAEEILGKKEQMGSLKKDKSNKKLGGDVRSRRKSQNGNNNNNKGSPEGMRRSLSPVKDRSKIPVINSAMTGFMPCEYYRKKWLREMGLSGESPNFGGTGYNAIQKTAGQKVVIKMTAQQKKLEEDAAAQRKRTEFIMFDEMILDNPSNPSISISPMIPIRKKQLRLEPLERTPPRCY